jgi:hypothetical protein
MRPITTDALSDLVEHADDGPTVSLTPRITPHTRERVVEDLRCGPKGSQESIDGPGFAAGRGPCSVRAVENAGFFLRHDEKDSYEVLCHWRK